MTKQEFEKIIGKEINDKDYYLIDRVYIFHPAISETNGKKQIADIYNAGGMEVIRNMVETADIMSELEKELSTARMALERVKTRIQNVRENGIEYEQCRKALLDAFEKANSEEEYKFARKLLANKYGSEEVDRLSEELKI